MFVSDQGPQQFYVPTNETSPNSAREKRARSEAEKIIPGYSLCDVVPVLQRVFTHSPHFQGHQMLTLFLQKISTWTLSCFQPEHSPHDCMLDHQHYVRLPSSRLIPGIRSLSHFFSLSSYIFDCSDSLCCS